MDEWIEKAKELAGEYAHCYAFVGDDTMPRKHKELMDHLDSACVCNEELDLLKEKAMLYDNFKSRIDGGIRCYTTKEGSTKLIRQCNQNYGNSTLILDDGVEL